MPRLPPLYPVSRAPVAQRKSGGLLSRGSGVRILPGATSLARLPLTGETAGFPRGPPSPSRSHRRAARAAPVMPVAAATTAAVMKMSGYRTPKSAVRMVTSLPP